ncbi:PTS system, beta-glucoside-specific IIA component [Enterococcus sp. DIV0187]
MLAKQIVEDVGGSKNIIKVWHCATRLRFKLVDEQKADTAALEALAGVVTVVQSAGQYQVVVGNSVGKVYEELIQLDDRFDNQVTNRVAEDNEENQSLINKLLAFVSSVFTPFLGALAASGILKGLLILAANFKLLSEADGAYQIWSASSDAIFYFLPLFIGFTAAKQLRVNQFVAVTIAGALVYPNLITLMSEGGGLEFFGLPIQSATYSASVIPILLAIWVLSFIEPFFDKLFPESVRNIFTPLLSIMIMVPVTLIVVEPIGNIVSSALATALGSVYSFSPMIAGLILGAIHQVIVIFGVHWALITLMINNISEFGQDPWLPIVCIAVFAQAGSALGVFLKTKDKKMKSIAGSAFITAIFSITEPAIYGVNLKLKKPMYFALIASGIGGAIAGFGQVQASTFTFPGILAIPTYLGTGFGFEVVGLIVGLCGATVLTYLFGVKTSDETETKTAGDLIVETPIDGKRIELQEVNDPAFSTGAMGKGFAVVPTEDTLRAPFSGTVSAIFPTNHAIGLTTNSGVELLIHIGIDTVQLNGDYFEALVSQGQEIKAGQALIRFDNEKIQAAGYDTTVIFVVTNSSEFENLQVDILQEQPIQLV